MKIYTYGILHLDIYIKTWFETQLNHLYHIWKVNMKISDVACSLTSKYFTIYKAPPINDVKSLIIHMHMTILDIIDIRGTHCTSM